MAHHRLSRSKRWLARAPYLVAPAILAAVVLLWARSYLPSEFFAFSREGRLILVFVDKPTSGMFVHGAISEGIVDIDGPYVEQTLGSLRSSARTHMSDPGLELIFGPAGGGGWAQYRILAVSYAYIASVLALLSAWSILALRRARPRWLDGHCRTCGYDIRENTERCPECGTAIPQTIQGAS